MAIPTVSERVHRAVQRWLLEHGRGANKRLAADVASIQLRRYPKRRALSPSLISMFQTGARPGAVDLDDVEALAEAMHMSLAQLLGVPQRGDLSAQEQRLLLAFRSLNPDAQDHLVFICEAMSLGTHLAVSRGGTPTSRPSRGAHATAPIPASASAPLDRVALLEQLRRISADLVDLLSHAEPRRQAADPGGDLPRPPPGTGTRG